MGLKDREKDRFFLTRRGEGWSVAEMEDEKCLESARTLPGLVGKLWASGNGDAYVRMDWVSSRGKTKHGKYPHFYNDLAQLTGYVEDVCEISREAVNRSERESWRLEFPGDLWMMEDERILRRVDGFSEMMREAVDDFIREEGLRFDEGADEPWERKAVKRDE